MKGRSKVRFIDRLRKFAGRRHHDGYQGFSTLARTFICVGKLKLIDPILFLSWIFGRIRLGVTLFLTWLLLLAFAWLIIAFHCFLSNRHHASSNDCRHTRTAGLDIGIFVDPKRAAVQAEQVSVFAFLGVYPFNRSVDFKGV
jgi:hypothetical protein